MSHYVNHHVPTLRMNCKACKFIYIVLSFCAPTQFSELMKPAAWSAKRLPIYLPLKTGVLETFRNA